MIAELLPHWRIKVACIFITIVVLFMLALCICVIIKMTLDIFINNTDISKNKTQTKNKCAIIITSIVGCLYLTTFIWGILMSINSFKPYRLLNVEEIMLKKIDEFSLDITNDGSYATEYFLLSDIDGTVVKIEKSKILEISEGNEFKLLVGEYQQDGMAFFNRDATRYKLVCPLDIARELNASLNQNCDPRYVIFE